MRRRKWILHKRHRRLDGRKLAHPAAGVFREGIRCGISRAKDEAYEEKRSLSRFRRFGGWPPVGAGGVGGGSPPSEGARAGLRKAHLRAGNPDSGGSLLQRAHSEGHGWACAKAISARAVSAAALPLPRGAGKLARRQSPRGRCRQRISPSEGARAGLRKAHLRAGGVGGGSLLQRARGRLAQGLSARAVPTTAVPLRGRTARRAGGLARGRFPRERCRLWRGRASHRFRASGARRRASRQCGFPAASMCRGAWC